MKILINCVRAKGDVLRTSFIAQGLKDKYRDQNPEIYWITNKDLKKLFGNNPYVDSMLSQEEKNTIQGMSFDLVVNLEDDEESCRFVSSLNSKKIIGIYLDKHGKVDYSPESSYWFDMSLSSKFGSKRADMLKKQNKLTHKQILASMLDLDSEKYEPFLRLTKYQRHLANNFLRRHDLKRTDIVIGINTGGADTWPKALSPKKSAKLIDKIYKKYKAKILLFGGPNELDRNKEIHKYSKSPIIDTGSGNDLEEFPALISVCNFFITTDSLGLHIALALKRKTICLVGPTSASEIDMYGLGTKIVSKSKEAGSYRRATLSCMEKINIEEIVIALNKMAKQKLTLLITAFNEPETISKAVESALNQKTKKKYDVILSAPDNETLSVAEKFARGNPRFRTFKDPGNGKSFALNILFEKTKSDILILTDGDVYISENTIEEISNMFLDPEIGCLTGRPIPIEDKNTKYGYWANFLFEAAHRWRKRAHENNDFLECSGYLFAFRKDKINSVPLDVAEDTVIPFYFWEKGYKIGYAENAKVYVKNVDNWQDWIKQKTRTSMAHETLDKYVDTKITPRVKGFTNEAKGLKWALSYASNPKEALWTTQLIMARLYMWAKVHKDTKLGNKHFQDAWERSESTK